MLGNIPCAFYRHHDHRTGTARGLMNLFVTWPWSAHVYISLGHTVLLITKPTYRKVRLAVAGVRHKSTVSQPRVRKVSVYHFDHFALHASYHCKRRCLRSVRHVRVILANSKELELVKLRIEDQDEQTYAHITDDQKPVNLR
jgi:hypothetical protein